MAVGIRHEDRTLGKTDGQTDEYDGGPGIVIRGVCSGDAFVMAEVLIDADTLGGEEAIHAWLNERGIYVKHARRGTARGRDRARDGSARAAGKLATLPPETEVAEHVPWLVRVRRQLRAWTFGTWPWR